MATSCKYSITIKYQGTTVLKHPKFRQWSWYTGGGLAIAIGIAVIFSPRSHGYAFYDDFLGWGAGLIIFLGIIMINKARKYAQKSADELLSEDKRPPVIYLRSFKDDRAAAAPAALTNWFVVYTEEEQLAHVLNDFGPCVAIGQPGEQLPDLGAARMYFADDEGEEKVLEFLAASKLVVLRAGATPNFFWEVEQSAKMVSPENLIILVPVSKKKYNEFRKNADQFFPEKLPDYVGSSIFSGKTGSLQGYIYFDKDWTPH